MPSVTSRRPIDRLHAFSTCARIEELARSRISPAPISGNASDTLCEVGLPAAIALLVVLLRSLFDDVAVYKSPETFTVSQPNIDGWSLAETAACDGPYASGGSSGRCELLFQRCRGDDCNATIGPAVVTLDGWDRGIWSAKAGG